MCSNNFGEGLLGAEDGLPFEVFNDDGSSEIVLICEHASKRIPSALGNLGLSETELASHVSWDPGALALAKALSVSLDAPLIAARFSRLVYDCNRPPEVESAMPSETEVCPIPGNIYISAKQRNARVEEIYKVFHQSISEVITNRAKHDKPSVVVSIHTFTPVFFGKPRYVDFGYLFSKNDQLAKVMLKNSPEDFPYRIRLNEPYGPKDGVLHTIDLHSSDGTFPHAMIEIRNDLLADQTGLHAVHDLISQVLQVSVGQLNQTSSVS